MAEGQFDVLICGGGFAGACLARQLKLTFPQLKIVIIDKLSRPVPEMTLKVGESLVETSSTYICRDLRMGDYLEKNHIPKLGLRFFVGDSGLPLQDRPEIGTGLLPPVPSYQIDRGRFENDLHTLVVGMGVTWLADTIVEDVDLSDDRSSDHVVHVRSQPTGEKKVLSGRWLFDAMGRRRFLQSRLNLGRSNGHCASAAWWRVSRRLKVTDLVGDADPDWQALSVDDRNHSTNHLMGKGYWIWLIPLSGGGTSIGIVTDESIHPVREYGQSFENALAWIKKHEYLLWAYLKEDAALDFHSLKNYSYHSAQVYSADRWGCVGEAAVFADPLYSVGGDFIAIGNNICVEMVRSDLAGEFTDELVGRFNRLFLEYLVPISLDFYRNMYPMFDHAHLFAAKFIWDTAFYWAFTSQATLQNMIVSPTDELFELLGKAQALNRRLQETLLAWSRRTSPRRPHAFIEINKPRLMQMQHLDLASRRSGQEFFKAEEENLAIFERLAQSLYWQAVAECFPDLAPAEPDRPPHVNPYEMELTREQALQWHENKQRQPSLRSIRDTFCGVFSPPSHRQLLLFELPNKFWTWNAGLLWHGLLPWVHRTFFVEKRARFGRQIFKLALGSPRNYRRTTG